MTSRLVSIALALVLLVTQQLGLQHLLTHGLQGAAGSVGARAVATSHEAPAHDDGSADELCQACVALVVLGSATLPEQPAWALPTAVHDTPAAPAIAPLLRHAASPYLARAPPSRA